MRGHLWKAAMPLAAPRSSFSFAQIVAAFCLTCSNQGPIRHAGQSFRTLALHMLGSFQVRISPYPKASRMSIHSPFPALLCTQRSTRQQVAIAIHTHMQAVAHCQALPEWLCAIVAAPPNRQRLAAWGPGFRV